MKLALNYSPAASMLVQSGQLDIDLFKTPNWDDTIADASKLKPVTVHFTLDVGNGGLGDVDWDKVSEQIEATGTPYINLHLDARQSYYPELPVDTTNPAEVEIVSQVILSDVMQVVEKFGAQRVIIENSAYQGVQGNTMQLCVQPQFIFWLIDTTGCGLLLDISHAVITAQHLGLSPQEYLSQLPVHRLKEMHFAGIHFNPASGLLVDHLSILDENWQWLDWAVGQIESGKWAQPWLLAFEYGGVGEPFEWRSKPEVIAAQVPLLYEHTKSLHN